ncbi:MAG: hypothetical protein ACLVJK_02970 [Alistipes putredinis]
MLAMTASTWTSIPHAELAWVMYGKATTELALAFSAGRHRRHRRYDQNLLDGRSRQISVRRLTAEEMRRIVAAAATGAIRRGTTLCRIRITKRYPETDEKRIVRTVARQFRSPNKNDRTIPMLEQLKKKIGRKSVSILF